MWIVQEVVLVVLHGDECLLHFRLVDHPVCYFHLLSNSLVLIVEGVCEILSSPFALFFNIPLQEGLVNINLRFVEVSGLVCCND